MAILACKINMGSHGTYCESQAFKQQAIEAGIDYKPEIFALWNQVVADMERASGDPNCRKRAETDAAYSRIRPENHPWSPHATHAEWMAISGRGAPLFAHIGSKTITSMITNRSGAISVIEAKTWRRASQQGSCVCWIWHGQ